MLLSYEYEVEAVEQWIENARLRVDTLKRSEFDQIDWLEWDKQEAASTLAYAEKVVLPEHGEASAYGFLANAESRRLVKRESELVDWLD